MAVALLTADDIRFRKFTPVRFREGYDPDEVDDFLEEVIATVEELTRIAQQATIASGTFPTIGGGQTMTDINNNPVVLGLQAEVQSLKTQLNDAQGALQNSSMNGGSNADNQKLLSDNQEMARRLRDADQEIARLRSASVSGSGANAVEEIQRLSDDLERMTNDYNKIKSANADLENRIKSLGDSSGADAGRVESLKIELEQVRKQLDESNSHVARLQVKLQSQESTNTGSFAAIGAAASSSNNSPGQAAAMLSMAQQLHDEYVQKGKNEKAKLVEEANTEREQLLEGAKAEHQRLIDEGKSERDKIITEAKKTADETYESLAKERTNIEKKIDELRLFEKDYRERLKTILEGLLDEVRTKGAKADSEEKE